VKTSFLLPALVLALSGAASAQSVSPLHGSRSAISLRSWQVAAKVYSNHLVTVATPRQTQRGDMPNHACTGVLISRQHVLTSGSCVSETKDLGRLIDPARLEIYFGNRITGASPPLAVARVTRHPEFDATSRRSDLAILQLKEPAPEILQPMPFASEAGAGPITQLGWMLDGNDHQVIADMAIPRIAADRCEAVVRDDLVEKAQTQFVDLVRSMQIRPDVAATTWRSLAGAMPKALTRGMICAAPDDGIPCDTDASALLVTQSASGPQLIGVLSTMPSCETAGMPGLYSSVAAYLPWIQQTVAQSAAASASEPDGERQRRFPAVIAAARLARNGGSTEGSMGSGAAPRIVGGVAAVPGFYPFQVSLILSEVAAGAEFDGFYCGGTRIGPRHVLTAAHCMVSSGKTLAAGDIHVYLGHSEFRDGQRIPVSRITVHPGWNPETLVDDVAVLELEREPEQNSLTDTIELMKPGAEYPARARAIGWGATDFQGSASRVLRETPMAVVDQASCDQSYRSFEARSVRSVIGEVVQLMGLSRASEDKLVKAVTDGADARIGPKMICAGSLFGSRSTCQGDSGGPLFSQGPDGKPLQIGVVSWTVACNTRNVYGVFTDVSKYADWIAEVAR
jgi:secreted trypsin-like serine protease